ncbi:MAG: amidase [Chloroflexi bacterium]|nr:MAG: amidase [Chloroflexota bacterium]
MGIKPTLGMVSTEGVFPLSRSLDTMGPLAPDVRTAARALEMMSGLGGLVPGELRGSYSVAMPAGWFDDLDEETSRAWAQVAHNLRPIDFPGWKELGEPGSVILYAEAAQLHRERVGSHPEKFGKDVLANLQRGLEVTAADYLQALEDRERLSDQVEEALAGVDAILVPATPRVAPRIDDSEGVRPVVTRFTRPFNVTGQPVVTIPAPVTGLPVGIQVVGRFGEDSLVAEVAAWLEESWRSG